VLLACGLSLAAGDDEILDPPTMAKGEKGKLPRKSDRRFYELGRVIDDEVLIAMLEQERGNVFRIAARFFLRDAELVKQYEKQENGTWLKLRIDLPDVYTVVGRKTFSGSTLPVIVKLKKK
jgi:hypothetical protein